ncbi:hypothetical protein Y032_0452g1699 [Ancylostoma ceylanicum]|uniref:Uncharacterized protein n=1 Tax=Ancylostoma ceylanicum TaxID=53326 RepID=A0A016WYI9_9BILA|nr:hypothetical protein Y032_0452g1699 [Ancylostoma ceylanicum]
MEALYYFDSACEPRRNIQGTQNGQLDADQCHGAAWHSICLLHSSTDNALIVLSDSLYAIWYTAPLNHIKLAV